jgi:ribosomal protein S19
MARSIKKGPFIDKSVAKAVEKIRASGQRPQEERHRPERRHGPSSGLGRGGRRAMTS